MNSFNPGDLVCLKARFSPEMMVVRENNGITTVLWQDAVGRTTSEDLPAQSLEAIHLPSSHFLTAFRRLADMLRRHVKLDPEDEEAQARDRYSVDCLISAFVVQIRDDTEAGELLFRTPFDGRAYPVDGITGAPRGVNLQLRGFGPLMVPVETLESARDQ